MKKASITEDKVISPIEAIRLRKDDFDLDRSDWEHFTWYLPNEAIWRLKMGQSTMVRECAWRGLLTTGMLKKTSMQAEANTVANALYL